MDKKLTLSLDKSIIEKAKNYAKSNNISLSKLIEYYLQTLTKKSSRKDNITPLVEELSGVISIDKEFDFKDDYSEFLLKKYK